MTRLPSRWISRVTMTTGIDHEITHQKHDETSQHRGRYRSVRTVGDRRLGDDTVKGDMMEYLISNPDNPIYIISGEGDIGTCEKYNGARTSRAIKSRLTKECSGGDRWARAIVYSHSNHCGDIYIDVTNGEYWSR